MCDKDRLISASTLKERLDRLEASGGHKYYRKGMDDTLHHFMPLIIDEQPTVDAVEVVRCKDCMWYDSDECGNLQIDMSACSHLYTQPDDFCSYGKRRGGE